MYVSKDNRFKRAKAGIGVVLSLLLIGVVASELPAQEMTEVRYGNQKLGEETTVKVSLDDPEFKLRKLNPKHVLYFEQSEARAAQVADVKALKAGQWTVPITAMKMALIPAGECVIGSPAEEKYRSIDEEQHSVKISKPFYMGKYEVTQRQFYYLTIPDYDFKSWKFRRGPLHVGAAFNYRTQLGWAKWLDPSIELLLDNPMECVSWITAVKYCKRLTEFERQAGRLPDGYEYRLPTEAEWEYACRGGTKSYFNTDAKLEGFLKLDTKAKAGDAKKSNAPKLVDFANVGSGPGIVGGDRKPNKFGLYDMHGNVSEWTLDTYAPYKPGDQEDPVNFKNEAGQYEYLNEKVVRGGSSQQMNPRVGPGETIEDKKNDFYHFRTLRSAARNRIPFDFDFNMTVGFRIVLAPEIAVPIPEVSEVN
jgi:formylglycine-generating enzyme required for sulfatase activity